MSNGEEGSRKKAYARTGSAVAYAVKYWMGISGLGLVSSELSSVANALFGAEILTQKQHREIKNAIGEENDQKQRIRGVFHQGLLGDVPFVMDQPCRKSNGTRNKALKFKQHSKKNMHDQGQEKRARGLPYRAFGFAVSLVISQNANDGRNTDRIDHDADDGQDRIGKQDDVVNEKHQHRFYQHRQDARAQKIANIQSR